MTKRSSTPADAVLVAIDMSKHRQEVLIERPEGGRRRRMTVMATKTDYDRLSTDLGDIGRPVIVGFEATGNYHRTLAHRLLSAGFEMRLISSVALARTREALHNGWDKNDSKDAQVILHMLRMVPPSVTSIRSPPALATYRRCRRRTKPSPRPRPRPGIGS
ncbi:Transposase [Novosphingobium sp. Rr 2-17]|nr:Transposase [Novosphingobium sp. Rr 2-17]